MKHYCGGLNHEVEDIQGKVASQQSAATAAVTSLSLYLTGAKRFLRQSKYGNERKGKRQGRVNRARG